MRRFVAALSAWLLWTVAACAPAADFEAGVDAYNRGDYAAAYREFLPLAEQGHAAAQFFLGFMYEEGRGVPQSDAQAVAWYRKAAEQGLADAQNNLGVMYHEGEGVPQSDAQAVEWLRKAAEQGWVLAQLNLGFMYYQGRGVPLDYVRAYAWFNLAAAQRIQEFAEVWGGQEVAEFRDSLRTVMTAAQLAEAQTLSGELFRRIEEGVED